MSRVQVFAIIAFALVLFVGWDFGQRILLTVSFSQSEHELDQQIAHAEATRAALDEQKSFTQTDLFVEQEMRSKHWVRDGETLAIPLITPAPTPDAAASHVTSTSDSSWWQVLFDLLFGP